MIIPRPRSLFVVTLTLATALAHGCASGGGNTDEDAGDDDDDDDDEDAGPPVVRERDTTPPTVSFVEPVEPCLPDGPVAFVFDVVDDGAGVGIVSATFAGTALPLTDDGAGRFTGTRDVTALSKGLHTLTVTAIDTDNNLADVDQVYGVAHDGFLEAASFTCGTAPDGGAPDGEPPVLTVTNPIEGSRHGASVDVGATTSDASPVTVTASVGAVTADLVGLATWSGAVDLTTIPEGPATVTVTATDEGGLSSSATRGIVVDHTLPIVTIVEPQAGETRAALTDVVVEATDAGGIARVALYRDGEAAPLAVAVAPVPGDPTRYGLIYHLSCAGLPASVTFVVDAFDTADNVASASVTVNVTTDGCEP